MRVQGGTVFDRNNVFYTDKRLIPLFGLQRGEEYLILEPLENGEFLLKYREKAESSNSFQEDREIIGYNFEKIYEGGLLNKQRHGKGREYDPKTGKLCFVGEFEKGVRNGKGIVIGVNGDDRKCYITQWKDGKQVDERESKEAKHLLKYVEGMDLDIHNNAIFVRIGRQVEGDEEWLLPPEIEFEGFINKNSFRKLVGSTYFYEKSRNELESQQSFCTEIRKFYEGCFDEEGKYDGNGKLFIKRTYTFEGKFHAGEMDEGLIRLNGIPLYEGKVNAKGEMNGKGKLFLSIPNNKNKKITLVDGNFHNNKLNGNVIIYQNPSSFSPSLKYLGEYVEGEMNGKGILFGDNDNYYLGYRMNREGNRFSIISPSKMNEYLSNKGFSVLEELNTLNCWQSGHLNGIVPIVIGDNYYEINFVNDEPQYRIEYSSSSSSSLQLIKTSRNDDNGKYDLCFMKINDEYKMYEGCYDENGVPHGEGIVMNEYGNVIMKGVFMNGVFMKGVIHVLVNEMNNYVFDVEFLSTNDVITWNAVCISNVSGKGKWYLNDNKYNDYYDGEILNNKRHGNGKQYDKRNGKWVELYAGEWANDSTHFPFRLSYCFPLPCLLLFNISPS